MKEKLEKIKAEALARIESADALEKLNDIRVAYLGKKGELTSVLKSMKDVAAEDRPRVGQMVNEAREQIEAKLEETKKELAKRSLDRAMENLQEQIRTNLRKGDVVSGQIRPPKEGERYVALLKVTEIGFEPPENAKHLVLFYNLTPIYPDRQLVMENGDKNLSIVYTPLNGAGLRCVTECLKKNGYTNIHVVKEQEHPDGHFPTCPYPNPEIREALELGLRDVKATGSDILIATDPDSDRVGIAVPNKAGDYTLLTGNETGVLLLDWIARRRQELGIMPKSPVAVKTIVTTDMAARIAQRYGIEMREVLTGFKYIGEQIGLLEKDGEADRYIFGFEESYGYLTGSYVRDKDAVDGSLMIADMTAYYRKRGRSLLDVLDGLYKEYGYFFNTLHSYEFEGEAGFAKMKAMTEKLRNTPPSAFAGSSVIVRNDYLNSISTDKDGNEKKIDLPVSDVMKFITESGISCRMQLSTARSTSPVPAAQAPSPMSQCMGLRKRAEPAKPIRIGAIVAVIATVAASPETSATF